MGGRLIWPLIEPVLDTIGRVVAGAVLTVYQNRTTTLATIYTDEAMTTPAANPQAGAYASNTAGRFFAQTHMFWAPVTALYTMRVDRPDGTFDVIDDIAVLESRRSGTLATDYPGVDNTGVSSSVTGLGLADAAGPVRVPAGTYLIDSDLTFSSFVAADPGAVFSVSTGKTLTFNKGFSAEVMRVFSGAGSVHFNNDFVTQAYPEWWGAVVDPTYAIDSYAAIQAAIDAFPSGGCEILLNRPYAISGTPTVTKNNTFLTALVPGSRYVNEPHLVSTSNTNPCVKFLGTSAGGDGDGTLENVGLKGVVCTRSAMGIAGSHTIEVINVLYCGIHDGGWSRSQYGLYAKNVAGLLIDGKPIFNVGGDLSGQILAGIYIDGTAQGSTGIIMNGSPLYYGGESPLASATYAYRDVATGGATQGAGDRQIDGLETSGAVNYVIYIEDNGGFSADVVITKITSDACTKQGITIKSPGKHVWHNSNLSNIWINLTNATLAAVGIQLEGRKNYSISNTTIINAGNVLNSAFVGKGSTGSLSLVWDGSVNWAKAIELIVDGGAGRCDQTSMHGCVGNNTGPIHWGAVSGGVAGGNAVPFAAFTVDVGSDFNHGAANAFASTTNNGAGNSFL